MATMSLDLKGGDGVKSQLEFYGRNIVKGGLLKVGYFENAKYPDGTSVAQVAFWQEFGNKRIPPRPTFRPMIAKHSSTWGKAFGKLLHFTKFDVKKALALMGKGIKDQLVESIVNTPQPQLSNITLMLRKMKDEDPQLVVTGATVAEAARRVAAGETGATGTRAKPLIDQGWMQRAPDYEVVTR